MLMSFKSVLCLKEETNVLTLKQVAWQLIFISGRTILAVPSKGLRHWVHRSFSCTILFNRKFILLHFYFIFHHERWFMLEITLSCTMSPTTTGSVLGMCHSLWKSLTLNHQLFEGKLNKISHIFTCQTSQRSSSCRTDLKECRQTCSETCRYQRSGYFTALRHIYIQP